MVSVAQEAPADRQVSPVFAVAAEGLASAEPLDNVDLKVRVEQLARWANVVLTDNEDMMEE